MSDPGKAVFLSYASQDSEAARKIRDALRTAGIEVWFDQSELRGGDAWDANIRRQIKECALFLAVISRHTQARAEGYFRREWKLGVERTHDMAEDVAFIVPVVIDDTSDALARVPDKFREVQWTRLPGGATPPAFVERVKVLLAGGDVARASRPVGAEIMGREAHAIPKLRRARGWPWLAAAAVVIGAIVALALWQPWRRPENPTGRMAAPVSEARQLVQQARALLSRGTQADFEAAEHFFEKAKALDPSDGEVWAVGAQIDQAYVGFYVDTSDKRKAQARDRAARAVQLAPDSFEARYALAAVLVYVVGEPSVFPEAERLIKSLLDERRGDKQVLYLRAKLLSLQGRNDEAITYYRRLNDPLAEGWIYFSMGRVAEAEAAADRAISSGNSKGWMILKENLESWVREDLEAGQAVIDQMPVSALQEEGIAGDAFYLRLYRREPDKALEVMRTIPRDWIWFNGFEQPKPGFTGWAHLEANRPVAAQADWRAALRLVEERLATQNNDPTLVGQKAWFLACLGEREEAERNLRLYQELRGEHENEITGDTVGTYLLLGRRDGITEALAAALKRNSYPTHVWLRYDPLWDPLRGDPRFEKLLRDTLPKGAKPFDDRKPGANPAPEAKK